MNRNHHAARRWFWIAAVILAALFSAFAVLTGAQAMSDQTRVAQIGLVTDSPVLMDGGYNQMSYAGLQQAESELGVQGTVYTATNPAEVQANMAQCVSDGNLLCIGVGFGTLEAVSTTAKMYTTTLFAILDNTFEQYPDNIQGVEFASEQAAYLAGTLAGKMTNSSILGSIGGMPIWPVTRFIDGFANGAICANPAVTQLITYTNTFVDPALGAQIAQTMMDQGADVIFAPAGPTGNGAVLTATQSGAWAIGVDVDQYNTVFEGGAVPGADHLLTSAIKRLDVATFGVISETVAGNFAPGTVIYDVGMGGVGLAPYHEADAAIPAAAKAAVDEARSGLIDGSLDPLSPCAVHKLYLPLSASAP